MFTFLAVASLLQAPLMVMPPTAILACEPSGAAVLAATHPTKEDSQRIEANDVPPGARIVIDLRTGVQQVVADPNLKPTDYDITVTGASGKPTHASLSCDGQKKMLKFR